MFEQEKQITNGEMPPPWALFDTLILIKQRVLIDPVVQNIIFCATETLEKGFNC